jgi:SAM-dependent methyltransferase
MNIGPYPHKFHLVNPHLRGLTDLVGYECIIEKIAEWGLGSLEGDVLEIGCFLGGGTAKFARASCLSGKTIYAVDTFDPFCDKTKNDAGYAMSDLYTWILGGRNQREVFEESIRGCHNVRVIEGDSRFLRFPEEQKFVFAFLDGNHDPEAVSADFENIWRHIVPGGAVGFHDYGGDLPQTTEAIDRILQAHQDEIELVETIPERWILFARKGRPGGVPEGD